MIFRSRRRRNGSTETSDVTTAALDEATDESLEEPAESQAPDEPVTGDSPATDQTDAAPTLAELDAQDWRELGPYDSSEVDPDALDDEIDNQSRIDLGSIVLGAAEDTELRLQVDEPSQQVVSAMMIRGDSALEVGAFAAPRSGGLWAEIRDELVQAAHEAGGSADLVPGPFGVELRRLLPVRTPDGQEGYQPSRMWVAEGPRWMLRGIVYGQAALEDGIDGAVAAFLEAFRTIVIRRGDEAMAPGDLLPLSLPENATPVAEAAEESGEA
ncbi:MAG: DUF3710 domain-containing protein [Microlunatus sp.]|nr:DUF3710 domain-containing protein [Microlunatus sp.]